MTENVEEQRVCLDCGKPIFGRMDKKFCSDGCRNQFNNRQNASSTNLIRRINSILKRNYRILSEVNTKGKTKSHREKLLKRGFDFDYFTEIYKTKAGDEYHFCYDQGYLDLGSGFVLLVKKDQD